MSRRRSIPVGISQMSPEALDQYLDKQRAEADKKIARQQLQVDLMTLIAFDWPGLDRPIHCFNARLRSHLISQNLATEADEQHLRLTPKFKALAAQVRQISTILFDLAKLKP